MRLFGLGRVRSKPAGGIAYVELIAATDFGEAAYDHSGERFTLKGTSEPFGVYVFRENGASYVEECRVDRGRTVVSHTLTMEFVESAQTRRAIEQLTAMSAEGLVAIVTTHSGERLLVGYSPRFAARFPLRPQKAALDIGKRQADFPTHRVVLVSEDTMSSKPIAV